MSKEDDVLDQEALAQKRCKLFWEGLSFQIEEYLKNKEDLKQYVMWDKVKLS
jgi:hypothetical protein